MAPLQAYTLTPGMFVSVMPRVQAGFRLHAPFLRISCRVVSTTTWVPVSHVKLDHHPSIHLDRSPPIPGVSRFSKDSASTIGICYFTVCLRRTAKAF